MVELQKKYEIGVRRFNVNWVGAYTLYIKETLRFLSVFGQTIVGPIITSILFLLVISLAIGENRQNVLGVEFIIFFSSRPNCNADNSTSFFTFIFIIINGQNYG